MRHFPQAFLFLSFLLLFSFFVESPGSGDRSDLTAHTSVNNLASGCGEDAPRVSFASDSVLPRDTRSLSMNECGDELSHPAADNADDEAEAIVPCGFRRIMQLRLK